MLTRPVHPSIGHVAFLQINGYWIIESFLAFISTIGLLIYYKIGILNIVLSFIMLLFVLLFLLSLELFVRSLDLWKRGLSFGIRISFWEIERIFSSYPPKYFSLFPKPLFILFFLFSAYLPVFFSILPILLYGKLFFIHLLIYLGLAIIFYSTSVYLWNKGLKRYEAYL